MFNTIQSLNIMRQYKHFQNQHNKFTQDKRFFQSTIDAFMYSVESLFYQYPSNPNLYIST